MYFLAKNALTFIKIESIVILFMLIAACQCFTREINGIKTPGCSGAECNLDFYYIQAIGVNDTLHYVWDLVKQPSLLVSNTRQNNNLSVNWNLYRHEKSCNKSLLFREPPNYTFVLILNKIIEFNDDNDNGILLNSSKNITYSTSYFNWTIVSPFKVSSDHSFANIEIRGNYYNETGPQLNGTVSLQLNGFGLKQYPLSLPRLLHSANSTEIKVTLQDLKSNSEFCCSRWALEFILISTDDKLTTSTVNIKRNLDDENSPGVFSIVDVVTPAAENMSYNGAYLQWRPVVYTTDVPSITNSSDVAAYNPINVSDPSVILNCSLALKFFEHDLNNLLVQRVMVSFGSSDDGFYKKTKYNSWSFLVTYGSPEGEQFSLFVILVIAIGLGVPAVAIIVGSIYLCTKRFSRRADELTFDR